MRRILTGAVLRAAGRGGALAAVLAGAGCMVGPNYAPPAPPTPPAPGFAAGADAAPFTAASEPPDQWWRLYRTPALDELVGKALRNNNSLKSAEANLRQARAALFLARAQRLPVTDLTAGATYGVSQNALLADDVLAQSARPAPYYAVGLDASWELDLFGRLRRAIQAAKADLAAAQAAEDYSRTSVAAETARAYLDACAFGEARKVAEQSLDLTVQTLDITLKEARFGAVSEFDVARARAAVEQSRAAVPQYEAQRRASLFALATLTGDPPELISREADACQAPPQLAQPLPAGDVRGVIRRRPDVRQAERQLASSVARVGVAVADLYPDVTLGLTAGTGGSRLSSFGTAATSSYSAGPLLSWSFPNTLSAQAQVRQAKAVASGAYAAFTQTVLSALQDAETALAAYVGEMQRRAALSAAVKQSQIAFTLARTQFNAGAASYLDVLTAQAAFISDEQALAASDEAVASDQVTLFKALGGGWREAPAVQPYPVPDRKAAPATP